MVLREMARRFRYSLGAISHLLTGAPVLVVGCLAVQKKPQGRDKKVGPAEWG